jgi:hypothetical protein
MRQDTRYDLWATVLINYRGIDLPCRKVLQRIYKYGGQPFVRDYLGKNYGKEFDDAFGKGTGKAIMHATAGRYG